MRDAPPRSASPRSSFRVVDRIDPTLRSGQAADDADILDGRPSLYEYRRPRRSALGAMLYGIGTAATALAVVVILGLLAGAIWSWLPTILGYWIPSVIVGSWLHQRAGEE